LEEFLEALPETLGFQPGPLVLGGFSQGGTTSLAHAMSHPGHLSGVVNLSGFLVDPGSMVDASRRRPEARGGTNRGEAAGESDGEAPEGSAAPGLEGPELLAQIPVFWGHGTEDPAVPFPLAVDGRRRLHTAGVNVEARDYRMGHQVSAEELDHLGSWLRGTIPGWA
jgi:phospholipase/carboxylesterase